MDRDQDLIYVRAMEAYDSGHDIVALAAFRELNNKMSEITMDTVECMWNYAFLEFFFGSYDFCIQLLNRIIEFCDSIRAVSLEYKIYAQLLKSIILPILGQYKGGKALYQKAMLELNQTKLFSQEAQNIAFCISIWVELYITEFFPKKFTETGLLKLNDTLAVGEKVSDGHCRMVGLHLVAFWQVKLGNHSEGIQGFENLLDQTSLDRYESIRCECLWRYMNYCITIGDLEKAEESFNDWRLIFSKIPESSWRTSNFFQFQRRLLQFRGQYDKAMTVLHAYMGILGENHMYRDLVGAQFTLVSLNVQLKNLAEAKAALDDFKQLIQGSHDPRSHETYQGAQALYLVATGTSRNRGNAEQILLQLLEKNPNSTDIIMGLCDCLIQEIYATKDLSIMDEIFPYLDRLSELSEKKFDIPLTINVFLLQAQVATIQKNTNRALERLIKAEAFAQKYQVKSLIQKILFEHDKLLKFWNKMDHNPEMSAELLLSGSGVVELIGDMTGQRLRLPNDVPPEIPIFFGLLTEPGVVLYSHQFTEKTYQEDLVGGFLTALSEFSKDLLARSFDRATFEDYMVILDRKAPFVFAYFYQGATYRAQQRLDNLYHEVTSHDTLWKSIINFSASGRVIQSGTLPGFDSALNKVFQKGKS